MTTNEMLLTILSEECNETAQRVSKAIRFSLEEVQEGQELSNAQRIVYEFSDIFAVMDMCYQRGMIPEIIDFNSVMEKKSKVEYYLAYSKQCGTINDCVCSGISELTSESPIKKRNFFSYVKTCWAWFTFSLKARAN